MKLTIALTALLAAQSQAFVPVTVPQISRVDVLLSMASEDPPMSKRKRILKGTVGTVERRGRVKLSTRLYMEQNPSDNGDSSEKVEKTYSYPKPLSSGDSSAKVEKTYSYRPYKTEKSYTFKPYKSVITTETKEEESRQLSVAEGYAALSREMKEKGEHPVSEGYDALVEEIKDKVNAVEDTLKEDAMTSVTEMKAMEDTKEEVVEEIVSISNESIVTDTAVEEDAMEESELINDKLGDKKIKDIVSTIEDAVKEDVKTTVTEITTTDEKEEEADELVSVSNETLTLSDTLPDTDTHHTAPLSPPLEESTQAQSLSPMEQTAAATTKTMFFASPIAEPPTSDASDTAVVTESNDSPGEMENEVGMDGDAAAVDDDDDSSPKKRYTFIKFQR
eukprot:CAMPEP_0172519614 /NCGR_PEP_ID=MMETSP1066-20121228/291523_1 /TAXON_ID=671091 /ORGANISM="Coscinodiscus wailesii, Strain CCMP2513" /LENGTH=390 /DNA_ID=CAMNT_0013302237 /DNA_START=670 /DNA_END=1842 /DNA_ORIENTATION=-